MVFVRTIAICIQCFEGNRNGEEILFSACHGNYDLQIETHIGIRITEATLEEILKELIGELLRQFNQADHQLTKTMEAELEEGLAKWTKEIKKAEEKTNESRCNIFRKI